MKIIVFGGTGWLGHNVVLQLINCNWDVTICSRGQKTGFLGEVKQVKRISADKQDEAAMKAVFADRYDVVIDTVPTEKSIDLIKKYAPGIKHYIHCSSTGGYAPLPFIPCNETAPYIGFDNSSGWRQKAVVDNKVMKLFCEEGFPATVIRPCYITGPGKLPLDNMGGRRPDYIADIIAEKPLLVPDNGLSLLQPVHIQDLAASFRLAITHPCSIGQIYNICLSHAVTLKRYHEITASALGKKANLRFSPLEELLKTPEGKVDSIGLRFLATHMCFSIGKAIKDLEYKPHCTPEEAIEETALWAAKNC